MATFNPHALLALLLLKGLCQIPKEFDVLFSEFTFCLYWTR